VVLRLGKKLKSGSTGSGLLFTLPFVDTTYKVDLRINTYDIKPQDILTRDSIAVTINAVVYMRVFNPESFVLSVEDPLVSALFLSATTLRNILGTKSFSEILCDNDLISNQLQVRKYSAGQLTCFHVISRKFTRIHVK